MDNVTNQIMDTIDNDGAFSRSVEGGIDLARNTLGSIDFDGIPTNALENTVRDFVGSFPTSFGGIEGKLGSFQNHVADQVNSMPDKLTMMSSCKCATSSLGMPSIGGAGDFFGSLMDVGDTFKVELAGVVSDLVDKAQNFISLSGAFNVRVGQVRDLMSGKLDSLIASEVDPTRLLNLQSLKNDIANGFASAQQAGRDSLFDRFSSLVPNDSAVTSAKNDLVSRIQGINGAMDLANQSKGALDTHANAGVALVNKEKQLADKAYNIMMKASDANTLRSLSQDPEVSALLGHVATDDMLRLLGRRQ